MNKHIFVFIRYSVVLKARKNNWIVGREEDFDGYKSRVFDITRLKARRALFEKVTLSSIDRQTEMSNVTVVLLTSDELPEVEIDALRVLTKSRPWLKIKELNEEEKNYERSINEEVKSLDSDLLYATVRLDDDDALAKDYFARLGMFLDEANVNRLVSFGMGYAGLFSEQHNGFTDFKRYYYPKIAIGLAKISKYNKEKDSFSSGSIYADGKHTIVDQRSVLLLDSRDPAFVRLIHSSADTVGVHDKKIAKMDSVELDEVSSHFDFELLTK
ncbi:glycosyltransferase [Alteromonas genovensis]|jgi:hypothetical protein|uniref:glycosyltransferase n=1 Tax=Alteromonas genovensis TaxID=471225 RepID=UPI002FE13D44